jgi:hypothetical protein
MKPSRRMRVPKPSRYTRILQGIAEVVGRRRTFHARLALDLADWIHDITARPRRRKL